MEIYHPMRSRGMRRLAMITGLGTAVVFAAPFPPTSGAEEAFHFKLNANHGEEVLHYGLMVSNEETVLGCVSCHDGATAKAVPVCMVGLCNLNGASSHPVGKPYPSDSDKLYVPVASLKAAGIKLRNGRVVCSSCHDLKNPKRPHLVLENDHSKLCLTCHIK